MTGVQTCALPISTKAAFDSAAAVLSTARRKAAQKLDALVDAAPMLADGDAAFSNKVALLTKPPKAKKDAGE